MTTQMEIAADPAKKRKRKRRLPARRELLVFLKEARAWAVANADRLARMHVLIKDDVFHMYIVPKTMPYDFELTKEHARFTISLWRKHRISAVGSQIPDGPAEDLTVYFDPTEAFTLTPV